MQCHTDMWPNIVSVINTYLTKIDKGTSNNKISNDLLIYLTQVYDWMDWLVFVYDVSNDP